MSYLDETGTAYLVKMLKGVQNNVDKVAENHSIIEIVAALPANPKTNVIYVKPMSSTTSTDGNKFDEFIYVNNAWEKIGVYTASVDLSNYITKTESEDNDNAVFNTLNARIITSVSLEDSTLKLSTYDKTYTVDLSSLKSNSTTSTTDLTDINKNAAYYMGVDYFTDNSQVTLTFKNLNNNSTWNVSLPTVTTTDAGVMSAEDKAKLDNLTIPTAITTAQIDAWYEGN